VHLEEIRQSKKSQKRTLYQLTLVVLLGFLTLEGAIDRLSWNAGGNYHSKLHNISLEHRCHTIWRCRPWFGSARSNSEGSGLAWCSTVLQTEFKTISHI